MDWKAGDWVTYDLDVGQIKEVRDGGCATVSNGHVEMSGVIADRFRPLTLRNKCIVETFDIYYRRLRNIDGEAGFNYPDIHRYFSHLALMAIDDDTEESKKFHELAQDFAREARDYKAVIHGVRLFRPKPISLAAS